MNLHSFSVKRPVFISMVSCIIVILGGISLSYLPVDLMPEITYPAISIRTTYEDASPEEVEELISRPLEEALAAVPRVKEIRSVSSEETSNITINFNWGANLDDAVSDVRDRIDRAMRKLPDDIDRPTIRKFDSANFPIMRIGISTTIDELEARKLVEDQVQYRLERIDGVASADLYGGKTREIHVLFDLDKAHALNISLDEVLNQIEIGNVTTPAGNVREDRLEIRVRTPGTYSNLQELAQTVIARGDNGDPVRLGDIAEVRDTVEKVTRFVRVNGKPGIQMALYKQSGANTVQVAKQVLAELDRINADYPQIQLRPILNSADYINRSISAVSDAAISGGLLAILVLLFFLRRVRSTLIISVSIPMSIIATFVLIYFCGFTLNIMTLGGLALGIGMLVDNSIVVLENITRLREEGVNSHDAAIQGTDEVAAAILASTLTTLAVFTPLLFVQGMAGVMFRQFSAVVSFSLACSLLAAISLVPMLSALLLKDSPNQGKHPHLLQVCLDFSERVTDRWEKSYRDALQQVLQHRKKTVLLVFAVLAICCIFVPFIGTELVPKGDEGEVRINIEREVGTSPEVMNEIVKQVEDTVIEIAGKDLVGMVSMAGNSGWRGDGGHNASFNVRLVSRTKRSRTSDEIAAAIGKALSGTPGIKVRARSGGGMFMMGAGNSEAVSVDVRGFDIDTSAAIARRIIAIAENIRGVTDAKLSRDLGSPEDRIIIDREKAADMHVSVKTIAESLRTILAGSSAGEFREKGEEYNILVKVKDADRRNLEELLDISINNDLGEKVTLRNLLKHQRTTGAVSIERKNQERVLSVAANLFDRDMGSVIAELKEDLKSIPLSADFSILFSGDYEEQVKAFRELIMAFVLALVLVYMVMACQFESYRDPFIVMLSVPLASCGVILALFLTKTTFNLQSFIGCIMLAGIVVNNAILLVDTANSLREQKMPPHDAVCEAGRRRLRPILMTTLTTVLGLFPMALGFGDGGETQAPLARVVIGGLTSSTFITLFFIPAIYLILEQRKEKKKNVSRNE